MKPIRAAAIVVHEGCILLIKRKKEGEDFYVFPGGSVEDQESYEAAAQREVLEETSIDVQISYKLYIHDYGSSEQHYFLATYLAGVPDLSSNSVEHSRQDEQNRYTPLWVPIERLPQLLLYPLEIRDWLIQDVHVNFSQRHFPRIIKLDSKDLRQNI